MPTAAVERAAHESILAACDVDASAVVIDGRVHTGVCRSEGRYYTLAGDVVVARSLYRATRSGKVGDPIALRVGAVEGSWLPDTAAAMSHLLQQGTSREAEDAINRSARAAARYAGASTRKGAGSDDSLPAGDRTSCVSYRPAAGLDEDFPTGACLDVDCQFNIPRWGRSAR